MEALERNVDLIIEQATKLDKEIVNKTRHLSPVQVRAKLRESDRLKREALKIDHIKATRLLYINHCGNEPIEEILPVLAVRFKKIFNVD